MFWSLYFLIYKICFAFDYVSKVSFDLEQSSLFFFFPCHCHFLSIQTSYFVECPTFWICLIITLMIRSTLNILARILHEWLCVFFIASLHETQYQVVLSLLLLCLINWLSSNCKYIMCGVLFWGHGNTLTLTKF